jgi:hypothetical protein
VGMPTNSNILKPVSDAVAKTEYEIADGVNADALDNMEISNWLRTVVLKANDAVKTKKEAEAAAQAVKTTAASGRLFPTLADDLANQYPLRRTPPATPAIQSASQASKWLGGLKKVAGPSQLLIMAYEAGNLATNPEARAKADEQYKEMGERDGLNTDILKNAGQGFLDPMGTIYTAGKGLMSESFRTGVAEGIKGLFKR